MFVGVEDRPTHVPREDPMYPFDLATAQRFSKDRIARLTDDARAIRVRRRAAAARARRAASFSQPGPSAS
jgi:hypothetical protein